VVREIMDGSRFRPRLDVTLRRRAESPFSPRVNYRRYPWAAAWPPEGASVGTDQATTGQPARPTEIAE